MTRSSAIALVALVLAASTVSADANPRDPLVSRRGPVTSSTEWLHQDFRSGDVRAPNRASTPSEHRYGWF